MTLGGYVRLNGVNVLQAETEMRGKHPSLFAGEDKKEKKIVRDR